MPTFDPKRLADAVFTTARDLTAGAATAVRGLVDDVQRRRRASADRADSQVSDPRPPAPARTEPAPGAAAPAQAPPGGEPEHVDSEAVLVAESADPGVSGSVGAQIHVEEPWEGYAQLDEPGVAARLEDASPETLAVVRLYESTHAARDEVISEIDRRLAAVSD